MDSLEVKFVGKFYGPYEIKGIAVSEDIKTPSGGFVFDVSLDDGRTIIVTERTLVAIVTEKATDHNHIRNAQVSAMVPEIVNLIEEYDIHGRDIVYMIETVAREIDARFDRVTNWFWTKDDSRFIPGFNSMNDATLLMAEKVIKTIPTQNEQGGTTDTDGATDAV